MFRLEAVRIGVKSRVFSFFNAGHCGIVASLQKQGRGAELCVLIYLGCLNFVNSYENKIIIKNKYKLQLSPPT